METKLYNSAVDLKDESQFGNGRVDVTAFLADAHVDVTGLEISSKEIHLKVGEKGQLTHVYYRKMQRIKRLFIYTMKAI